MESVLKRFGLEKQDLDFHCPPSIGFKIAVRPELIGNWYIIGRTLEVSVGKLKSIRDNHTLPKPEDKAVAALDVWDEEKGSGATCLKLAEALYDHKMISAFEFLCEEVKVYREKTSESATTSGPTTSTLQPQRRQLEEDVPTSKFSMEQRKKMYDKCSDKSHFLTYRFQELFSSTKESLKKKKVTVSKLVDHLECLGWFKPTYKDTGLLPLRHQMPKLRGAKSTDFVMSVVSNYCSFFNYYMIEHIINKLGTPQDKTNLAEYKKHFKSYADNYVIKCPLEVGEMIGEGQANMYVTLDDSFDNCTLSHINMFKSNLREILDLKSDIELYLYYINLGSIKLTFQISILIQKAIFPLSSKQEDALKGLGVVQLSSGDYQFPRHDNEEVRDPDGDSEEHTDIKGSMDSIENEDIILSQVDDTPIREDEWNVVVMETKSLAANWEEIIVSLGLPPDVLDEIRMLDGDCYLHWSEALKKWIKQSYNTKKFGDPSWRTLLKAIAGVDKMMVKKLAADHPLRKVDQVEPEDHGEGFETSTTNKSEDKEEELATDSISCMPVRFKPYLSFPLLDLKKIDPEEKEMLHQRLCAESEDMTYKFQQLFNKTRKSLVVQQISVDDLLKYLDCLGSVKPTFQGSDLPVLGCQLPELRKTESVDKAMSVISSYCSFFSYRCVEEIINNLGTERDKTNLKNYQEEFRVYAQRRIFECPSELGEMSEIGHANIVTLDATYESYTVSHLYTFVYNLQRVLKIPAVSLRLCRIKPG